MNPRLLALLLALVLLAQVSSADLSINVFTAYKEGHFSECANQAADALEHAENPPALTREERTYVRMMYAYCEAALADRAEGEDRTAHASIAHDLFKQLLDSGEWQDTGTILTEMGVLFHLGRCGDIRKYGAALLETDEAVGTTYALLGECDVRDVLRADRESRFAEREIARASAINHFAVATEVLATEEEDAEPGSAAVLMDIGADLEKIHESRRAYDAFVAAEQKGAEDAPGLVCQSQYEAYGAEIAKYKCRQATHQGSTESRMRAFSASARIDIDCKDYRAAVEDIRAAIGLTREPPRAFFNLLAAGEAWLNHVDTALFILNENVETGYLPALKTRSQLLCNQGQKLPARIDAIRYAERCAKDVTCRGEASQLSTCPIREVVYPPLTDTAVIETVPSAPSGKLRESTRPVPGPEHPRRNVGADRPSQSMVVMNARRSISEQATYTADVWSAGPPRRLGIGRVYRSVV